MDFRLAETTDMPENMGKEEVSISSGIKNKFDNMMEDDKLPENTAFYDELPAADLDIPVNDEPNGYESEEIEQIPAEQTGSLLQEQKDDPKNILGQNGIETAEKEEPDYVPENEERDVASGCPIEGHNGHWEGERGNSKWIPDDDCVPTRYNPDGLSWKEIKDQYDIDGIGFKDGQPDFSGIAKAEVKIDDFTDDRVSNFVQADEQAALQRGCTPGEVKKWRQENGYTWHECRDCETIQKVPGEVHNNIDHSGGVSEYKRMNGGD